MEILVIQNKEMKEYKIKGEMKKKKKMKRNQKKIKNNML